MKKIILLITLVSSIIFAWETTTHRAIDQTAIKSSQAVNWRNFLKNSGLNNSPFNSRNTLMLEGYGMTYMEYIDYGEGDGISKWEQTFHSNPTPSDLIEVGTMLEDALWQDSDTIAMGGDGRFNNHFYEAQNDGHKLTYGYGFHVNAVDWATDSSVPTANPNLYNYPRALRYFKLGFTEKDPTVRKKYQAKMLVSVGHLMHLLNDMNVPAHVRDDAHPLTDPLEVWMRGGWDGKNTNMGFHVMGSKIKGNISGKVDTTYKHNKFADFMTSEASYTSRNFLSASTLNLNNSSYKPNTSTISYSQWYPLGGGVSKRYVRNANKTKIALELKSYICNKFITLGVPKGRGLCSNSVIKGDYSVLQESGQVLIKRAISNASGFLNYFFRGQISAKIDGDSITITNDSDPSLVKDENTATLTSGGYFYFKYTTNNDNTLRDFEFKRDVDDTSKIESMGENELTTRTGFTSLVSLAPGESIVVAIQRDTSITSKNIVVIYDGEIGDADGIAVCAAKTPSSMMEY